MEMVEYEHERKEKKKKWAKLQEQKRSMITVIHGQLDDDTLQELELSPGFIKAQKDGDIVQIMKNLHDICHGGDDGGLSHRLYKVVGQLKSLLNFTCPNPSRPHEFKEELKIKF